jgi:hypothetical protein
MSSVSSRLLGPKANRIERREVSGLGLGAWPPGKEENASLCQRSNHIFLRFEIDQLNKK